MQLGIDWTRDVNAAPPKARANRSVPKAARPRVESQAARVLALLRGGRTSVSELKAVASQYNARIHELRAAGYRIENVAQNKTTGESWYELRAEPTAVADGVFVVPADPAAAPRHSSPEAKE